MIQFLKRIWRAAPVATVILALALAAALFFSARMIAHAIYWNDPAHQEQVIAPWMTPGYVAQSWDVPRAVIADALDGFGVRQPRPMNFDRLADELGVPVEDLIAATQAAIAEFRATSDTGPDGAP